MKSRTKIRNFVAKHRGMIDKSFLENRDLLRLAKDHLGYSATTAKGVIAATLDRFLEDPEYGQGSSEKPKTRKAREMVTYESVVNRRHFVFHGPTVRACFATDNEFKAFVEQYVKCRQVGGANRWQPPVDELELYEKYESDELSLDDVRQALNLNNNKLAMERMGRIYAYKKEQSRR